MPHSPQAALQPGRIQPVRAICGAFDRGGSKYRHDLWHRLVRLSPASYAFPSSFPASSRHTASAFR
ncbi:MAG: hypothetical protein FWD61_09210 [Phycisphaerales bacterium]|nr:hypothetical protein [Phycisphaerales bacterium]